MDLFRRMRRAPQVPVNFPIREERMASNRASDPESAPPTGPNPNTETQSQIGPATTSNDDTPAEATPAGHNPMLSLANTADILLRTGLDPDILHAAVTIQRERDERGVVEAANPDPAQPSLPQASEPDHAADEEDAAIDAAQPLVTVTPPDQYPQQPHQYPQQPHQYYQQPHQYYQQPQQYYQQPQQYPQQPHQYHHQPNQYYHQPHQYYQPQPQQLQAPPAAPNFRFYNPETRRAQLQPTHAPAPAPAPVIIDLTSPERPAPKRNHDEADLE